MGVRNMIASLSIHKTVCACESQLNFIWRFKNIFSGCGISIGIELLYHANVMPLPKPCVCRFPSCNLQMSCSITQISIWSFSIQDSPSFDKVYYLVHDVASLLCAYQSKLVSCLWIWYIWTAESSLGKKLAGKDSIECVLERIVVVRLALCIVTPSSQDVYSLQT